MTRTNKAQIVAIGESSEERGIVEPVRDSTGLTSSGDLLPSERRFIAALQQLGYGRFESLGIRAGELILDPWPTSIRSIKFGTATPNQPAIGSEAFELKKEVVDFFAHVRSSDSGLIRILEVRGGLPFAMDVENTD